MNTQETPIHNHLWNKDFGSLVSANLLLTTAIYMMIPAVAGWLRQAGMPSFQKGLVMGAYGAGLFVLGPFCSYFVERYRRNHVCEWAILLLAACIWGFGVLQASGPSAHAEASPLVALRAAIGALFGLAQMVLCSTLVIDACESHQRTRANHATAWFGRLSLALGPLMAVALRQFLPAIPACWVMAGLCIVATILIQMVKIPFRAPSDNYPSFSLDRFLLPASWPLFLVLMSFTTVVGSIIVQPHDALYNVFMLLGFLIARLLQPLLEDDVTLRTANGLAMVVMMAAVSPGVTSHTILIYLSATLMGLSAGIVGNSFLTCFLNLSHHCQRGTSQSSFFLAWEVGISLGLFLAFALSGTAAEGEGGGLSVVFLAQALLLVGALVWMFLVYPWYKGHKIR